MASEAATLVTGRFMVELKAQREDEGQDKLDKGFGVVFQICTSPIQSMNPNSYRLTNNPMTISCICMDLEKQIVLRVSRLMRVRKVRCFRSICCVLRLPGWC